MVLCYRYATFKCHYFMQIFFAAVFISTLVSLATADDSPCSLARVLSLSTLGVGVSLVLCVANH